MTLYLCVKCRSYKCRHSRTTILRIIRISRLIRLIAFSP
jgi:hypothetical protein